MVNMYFESHAHYDDSKFDEDRDKLIPALKEKGIEYIINVGANIKSSIKSVELAEKYDFIYAAVGVHPHDVAKLDEDDMDRLYGLSQRDKVVAIGEIGLDYYYDSSPRDIQKDWFVEQIELAKEMELPIIVHSRDAAKDTFDIIKGTEAGDVGGVIHCFSGSAEMAKEYIEEGFYIGVGGIVTFTDANKIIEVVKQIPLEKILIETDCPYLSPIPNRGKRNESTNLVYIVDKIAEIKNLSTEEVAKATLKNAKTLFDIE